MYIFTYIHSYIHSYSKRTNVTTYFKGIFLPELSSFQCGKMGSLGRSEWLGPGCSSLENITVTYVNHMAIAYSYIHTYVVVVILFMIHSVGFVINFMKTSMFF